MPNVPGLTPTQDQPSGGRQRIRQSLTLDDGSQMRMPNLKPAAAPVDTYHRPAQAPINHDLENLAQGLSSLNSALSRFARVEQREDKHIDKDALTARYGGKSGDEIRAAMGSDPELQNKFAATFVGNIASQKQGDADVLALDNWYANDADKNSDIGKQVDEFVAKRMTERFQGNPAGAEHYMERMAGGKRSLMDRHNKFLAEQGGVARMQNTQDGFASILRQGVDTEASPEKLIGAAGEFMRTNRAVMNVGYKEQMQYQLEAVRPLLNDMDATPDKRDRIYGAVEALFTQPRKDSQTGIERRLIDAPDGIGEMAQKTLTEFRKKRDELNDKYLVRETAQWKYNAENAPEKVDPEKFLAWSKAHPGAFRTGEEQAILKAREEALDKAARAAADYDAGQKVRASEADVTAKDYQDFKDGQFILPKDAEVPTKDYFLKGDTGAVKKLGADDRRQRVVDTFSKDLDFQKNQLVNSKRATAEQADDWARGQELALYSRNGMIPTEWKQELKAGANQLTLASAQASKEMPQTALQAYERYRLLATRAPNLLSEVSDERTRMIFETAMVADGSPTDQLRGAILAHANRGDKREAVTGQKAREAVTKMANAGWGQWLAGMFGGETPDNLGVLNDEVQKRATYIVQSQGVTPEEAVKRGLASVQSHYTLINGTAVLTNDRRLPENFKTTVETYLRNIVADLGADKFGVQSHRDLTLLPMQDGSFMLQNKRDPYGAMPAVSMKWSDGRERDLRFLDAEMIQSLAGLEREKAEIRAVREGERRLQPLFVIPGTRLGMGRPSLSGYTPEEEHKIQQNINNHGAEVANEMVKRARTMSRIKEEADDNAQTLLDSATGKTTPFPLKNTILLKDSKRD